MFSSIGAITGWVAAASVLAAGAVPTGQRLLFGKRAPIDSKPIRSHVVFGASAAAIAFLHALAVLPSLGSPEAIGAGDWPLASGAFAFLLLMAHVGVGQQLRNPKLKTRPRMRRTHVAFATAIILAVGWHVTMLLRSHY